MKKKVKKTNQKNEKKDVFVKVIKNQFKQLKQY